MSRTSGKPAAKTAREKLVRVRRVEPLRGFVVRVSFTDRTSREIDLAPFLRGPIFEPIIQDPELFRRVEVDGELGTIVWPNGADIDPDVLYDDLAPAWRST